MDTIVEHPHTDELEIFPGPPIRPKFLDRSRKCANNPCLEFPDPTRHAVTQSPRGKPTMNRTARPLAGSTPLFTGLLGPTVLVVVGCVSPYSPYYHTDEGAVAGGLVGAGTGAVVGHALGEHGGRRRGGAGVGVLEGPPIGSRASTSRRPATGRMIRGPRLGRQLAVGAVSPEDVAYDVPGGSE